jgi:glycosyltransferase involved in cell wall biosynthesis
MTHKLQKLSGLSIVFPAYNDEKSIPVLIKRVLKIVDKVSKDFEIIVVNDGSPDNIAEVLEKLQQQIPKLRVITHQKNKGYGATIADGILHAKKEYVFYTDGDGQYDVRELPLLVAAMNRDVDVVNGYKMKRSDPLIRKVVGACYNQTVKLIFRLPVRDINCDFRLFRRSFIEGMRFECKSGSFGVELIKRMERRGARFVNVPVHHYSRMYGHSQFFYPTRIWRSIWQLRKIWRYRAIFR